MVSNRDSTQTDGNLCKDIKSKNHVLPVLKSFDCFENDMSIFASRIEAVANLLRDEVHLRQPLLLHVRLVLNQLVLARRK